MFLDILRFEARRMSRNFAPVFFALAFPVMLLLVFGGIYGNKPSAQFGGHGVVDSSVPAYLVMIVSVTGLMSFPLGLAEYRDRKILKRFRATPARPSAFLLAQALVNILTSLVGAALLVVVGTIAFGLHMPINPIRAVGALVLATFAMYAVGSVIAAVAPTERVATVLANLVYFPMIFISGATIPLSIFPATMRHFADALPATYGVNLLQQAWLGTATNALTDAAVLGGAVVVSAAIAVRFFRWE